MNFKSLKVVLISFALTVAGNSLAETMPESAKAKEQRIEQDLNILFQRSMNTAALKLDKMKEVRPFAIIKKTDGTFGVFEPKVNEKTKDMTVNEQSMAVRNLLKKLAIADQIEAASAVMYAVVENPNTKEKKQGLTFSMEHKEGISLMRFLPVSKSKNEEGKEILVFELENLETVNKPQVVFN